MRWLTCVLVPVLVAGCSAGPDETRREDRVPADLAQSSSVAAPGVAVTAAPGVAFNYRYDFRLPPARIASAQEAHAQACEKLGVARCRITGMRYSLAGGDRIDAMLAFKLDPGIARAFGRQGISAIENAEGMLINAEISGVDAGAEIARVETDRSRIEQERSRIERELAVAGLRSDARTELLRQRAALDQQVRAATTQIGQQRDSLATTPMVFNYESGTAIRRFDPRSPFADAADTALGSLQWTLAFTLGAVALLGPPALLLALLAFAWFRLRRHLPRLRRPTAD